MTLCSRLELLFLQTAPQFSRQDLHARVCEYHDNVGTQDSLTRTKRYDTIQTQHAVPTYNRWDRGYPRRKLGTTTIIIHATCAHRYIACVRSFRVLILMMSGTMTCSGYYGGRSCPIWTRCFHRCSARISTIPSIVERSPARALCESHHPIGCCTKPCFSVTLFGGRRQYRPGLLGQVPCPSPGGEVGLVQRGRRYDT